MRSKLSRVVLLGTRTKLLFRMVCFTCYPYLTYTREHTEGIAACVNSFNASSKLGSHWKHVGLITCWGRYFGKDGKNCSTRVIQSRIQPDFSHFLHSRIPFLCKQYLLFAYKFNQEFRFVDPSRSDQLT